MLRSGDSVVLGLVVWRQVTDENVAQLRNFIQQTLNPDKSIRDQAENYLRSVEHTQGFPLLTHGRMAVFVCCRWCVCIGTTCSHVGYRTVLVCLLAFGVWSSWLLSFVLCL